MRVPETQTGSVDVRAEFDSGPLAGMLKVVTTVQVRGRQPMR